MLLCKNKTVNILVLTTTVYTKFKNFCESFFLIKYLYN